MKSTLQIGLFIVLLFLGTKIKAQSNPFTYDYHFNTYLINPAAAGQNVNGMSIRIIDRQQWLMLPGSPQTGSLSFTTLINDMHGIGVMIGRDAIGLQNRLLGKVSYSHHSKIEKHNNRNLAFGIAAEVYQYTFNKSFTDPLAQADRGFNAAIEKKIYPNATLGTIFYGDKGYFGVSVMNVIKPQIYKDLDPFLVHVALARREEISKNFTLEINTLLKANSDYQISVDVNSILSYTNKVWLGASYRLPRAILVMTGYNFGPFSIGYAFEYSLAQVTTASFGTHSAMLGYNVFNKNKSKQGAADCPAYF